MHRYLTETNTSVRCLLPNIRLLYLMQLSRDVCCIPSRYEICEYLPLFNMTYPPAGFHNPILVKVSTFA